MRAEKQYLISEVETHLKKSDYVILANFTKVNVADVAQLQRILGNHGVDVMVDGKRPGETEYQGQTPFTQPVNNFCQAATGIVQQRALQPVQRP